MTEPDDSGVGERTPPDQDRRSEDQSPRLIVGIGASAGGLEALTRFLENMSPESGMGFVVVQHLMPDRPSMLSELLARRTTMAVSEARDGVAIERNNVYIVPPGASLAVEDARLRVVEPFGAEQHHTVIDRFLQSLAEDQGPKAACVILSGAGHEGTLGVRVVKEHGGLTIAQNAATAAHPSMPASAAAAGYVDLVLAVEDMPRALIDHADHRVQFDDAIDDLAGEASLVDRLGRLHELLRDQHKHDFSMYKQNMVLRRVRRRMQLLQIPDVGAYVERLEGDPRELSQLFHDLLIGVTHFFRDPAAFEALARNVIPALVADRGAGEWIRVWVPGCGSGEEAYSIAILLLEELSKSPQPPQLQIFATDIDDAALSTARLGIYPAAALGEMSRARVERYFALDNGLYRVTKSLRSVCMFALQDVVTDPPFSRLDLISCRNLLIYLESELQARLVRLFHHALRDEGFLFLGSAETIGRNGRLFQPVDRKHRIFRRRIDRRATHPSFPANPFARRSRDRQEAAEAPVKPLGKWAESLVLARHAPAFFVLDEHFDVVQFSPRISPFLEPAAGAASLNVFGLIHPELRMALRAVLQAARGQGTAVEQQAIRIHHDQGPRLVDLIVEPHEQREGGGLYLVVLREHRVLTDAGRGSTPGDLEEASIAQLEFELSATRERLQSSVEQLETINQELSSSNEELLSTNEELQSSNEELEASQEELQSLNEELETVNSELRDKVDELDRANNDLLNLFDATAIATLFLDAELRIKRFTPSLSEVIAVQHGDEGRLVSDFALRVEHRSLLDDARAALRDGAVQEVEVVRGQDGRTFLLRIAPYRTSEQVIEGAVLTFVDISRLKEVERQLLTHQRRAEVALAAGGGGLYEHAVPPGPETYYSKRWAASLGFESHEVPAPHDRLHWLLERVHPDDRDPLSKAYQRLVRGEVERYDVQVRLRHEDGHWVWVRDMCQPVERDPEGRPIRVAGLMFDVTAERAAAEELSQTLENLRLALDAGCLGMWAWDLSEGRMVWDERTFALLGLDPGETRPSLERLLEAVHPDDRDALRRTIEAVVAKGEAYNTEFRIVLPDGSVKRLRGLGQAQRDAPGQGARLIGVHLDTSDPPKRDGGPEPAAADPRAPGRNGNRRPS